MAIEVDAKVDAEGKFRKALEEATKKVGDLTIPLTEIAKRFFKEQTFIFKLKGPGRYVDLKPATKKEKLRLGYSIYPINVRTKRLMESLTNASASESVNQIINKKVLLLGSRVPYANWIQHGTGNMPARKILFIGPEAAHLASPDMLKRPDNWAATLGDYVLQKSSKIGRVS